MKAFWVVLGAGLCASPAAAALSGWYDSAEKISAILGDAALADQHRQMPLRKIENIGTDKDGADLWEVESQDCRMVVRLRALPPKGIGKTTWEVEGRGACD
ncbi:hypothetical protein [Falsigemmobacter faecalis]|uniref:PepSY domain-containing protein n=1 Tax=Falsigemmobacter faecalis TaxID=2488730 RepID=A0A3P3DJ09_9RHOB|nr:hypothetical protein [Falsigemmobacter faecalis]RRH72608.1 hypothetical protein EG244_14325 [Falsigemmobacter faecalis]